jgi:ribosomal protein S18 acetylase RimI-like enzyme
MIIRDATINDAEDLARLLNMAGEGMPLHLWKQMAEKGQDPMSVGALRAARDEGSFSYRNARVAEIDGATAGMLLGYRLPDPYPLDDVNDYPDIVRPLVALEAKVPGSWYINAIAAYEAYRGQGVGTALMAECDGRARSASAPSLSLIVASENKGAHSLYLRLGFREIASRPLLAYPGGPDGGQWLLMSTRGIH